jgi:type II restriction/modification system DNA methylase subunit YeeA
LVLKAITKTLKIVEAWSDQPWIVEGAAVRVSLVCFGKAFYNSPHAILDGAVVDHINNDLTGMHGGRGLDLTQAVRLRENRAVAFMATIKAGLFDISGNVARTWLQLPLNPNEHSNSDVIRPWVNSFDILRRRRDIWVVDFGIQMSAEEAALYEAPFAHVLTAVKPKRDLVRKTQYRRRWWLFAEPCGGMRKRIEVLSRYIATPTVAKHRIFVWLDCTIVPDHQLIVTTRDDDTTFGVLHGRLHELWSLRLGTSLEDRPRYTPSTTFETFPFPDGLTPDIPAEAYADDPRAHRIAAAAKRLNGLRENWLNPPDLVVRVPEVVPGYPDRILPKDEEAAKELKKRTLTNLYNQRPAWLDNIHKELDAAVAAAYGWPADLSDDEILARLFKLNQERAGISRDPGISERAAVP